MRRHDVALAAKARRAPLASRLLSALSRGSRLRLRRVLLPAAALGVLPFVGPSTSAAAAPSPVEAATRVALGTSHTCAAKDGGVWCWGDSTLGQLGLGGMVLPSATPPPGCRVVSQGIECDVPKKVPSLSGVKQVVAGMSFTCALLGDGTIRCWGSDLYGQLGIGGGKPTGCHGKRSDPIEGVWCNIPKKVVGISNAVELSAGDFHTCARLDDGTLRCWGHAGTGALGIGDVTQCKANVRGVQYCDAPKKVRGLSNVVAFAAGGGEGVGGHTCAVDASGAVRCWGRFDDGQLGIGYAPTGCFDVDGDGKPEYCPLPKKVLLIDDAVDVAVGSRHTCAIRNTASGRKLWCWGNNRKAALCVGSPTGGELTACEVDGGDFQWCWSPVPASGSRAIAADGGLQKTAFIEPSGGAKACGLSLQGALGIGAPPHPPSCNGDECRDPLPIKGLGSDVAQVVISEYHGCAVKKDGTVRCWGSNGAGRLGLGNRVPANCTDPDGNGRANVCYVAVQVTSF